jgi:hypothetical protein
MGGSKPKPIQTPFQQQQTNTFSYYSPLNAQSPGVSDYLNTPLDFGQGVYTGDAYKDIKTDFDIDPGVGRRADLAEQAAQNRWNSAFMSGIPQEYRQMLRDSETRQIRSQGAAERQQAEYARQQLQNQAALQRAQMRDQSELARANIASQRTLAELQRRRDLLPQLVQTGGSSSGFNTQIGQQGGGGFWSGFGSGLGSALGGGLI